jgi:hypothetical protein
LLYLGAVLAVVHEEDFEVGQVVDDKLLEAVWQHVPGLQAKGSGQPTTIRLASTD